MNSQLSRQVEVQRALGSATHEHNSVTFLFASMARVSRTGLPSPTARNSVANSGASAQKKRNGLAPCQSQPIDLIGRNGEIPARDPLHPIERRTTPQQHSSAEQISCASTSQEGPSLRLAGAAGTLTSHPSFACVVT